MVSVFGAQFFTSGAELFPAASFVLCFGLYSNDTLITLIPQKEKEELEKVGGWKALMTPEGIPYYFNVFSNITTWDKPEELKTEADQDRAVLLL